MSRATFADPFISSVLSGGRGKQDVAVKRANIDMRSQPFACAGDHFVAVKGIEKV